MEIRREWLTHGLSTEPADRTAAQGCLTRLYARVSRPRPRFVWVDSPRSALPLVAGLPAHEALHSWVRDRRPPGKPPVMSDLLAALSRLRGSLEETLVHPDLLPAPPPAARPQPKSDKATKPHWAAFAPTDALVAGAPLREVLRISVWHALRTSLADGFYLPVRAALPTDGPVPSAFYGQQDAYWVAFYDVIRRLELTRYGRADDAQLDDWAILARTCGWWWPGEDVCVIVERPAAIRVEPLRGGWHEQVAPSRGAPIEFRDGWRPTIGDRGLVLAA